MSSALRSFSRQALSTFLRSKFTHDIVNKYMQDDRVRMEHEAAIIRLRENALKEKMQAQLEWIELQKINAQKRGKKGEILVM